MGQLKQLEQQILDEWRRFAESKHDAEEFSEDGLLWRGLIYYADGSWHRREGNEEELWLNAKRRLLILTKDLNDTEAWNIRQETGRQNTAVFSYQYGAPFIKNLRMCFRRIRILILRILFQRLFDHLISHPMK